MASMGGRSAAACGCLARRTKISRAAARMPSISTSFSKAAVSALSTALPACTTHCRAAAAVPAASDGAAKPKHRVIKKRHNNTSGMALLWAVPLYLREQFNIVPPAAPP
ncbi:exported hypothetical protein [uncultured Desulfovibrio sp.]|uniref:Uncharacterized protein n=1 Tax=uncultured Desulfovibrio sp. TaxID=167968 RepID=A0A212L8X1_9BACT|nr:exported hypothetical protein [uncultured Desulfovibrio sp.]VZH34538.1 conserved protein of unknown function [Desulfovibrio sp. 86]